MPISYDDFLNVDIRSGTIIAVDDFPEAKRPAYRLTIDFGNEVGIKKSSAQITAHYNPEKLIGSQVQAVVNFAPKQIGKFMSEVLVLGFYDEANNVVLCRPDRPVPNGQKLI